MTTSVHEDSRSVTVGDVVLTVDDVHAVAIGKAEVRLSNRPEFRQRIDKGAAFLHDMLARGKPVYGVTTGYGDSCTVEIPSSLLEELPLHLTRYHGCGTGRLLDQQQAAAVVITRLNSLAQGYSAVRMDVLEQLEALLRHKLYPAIPEEGSVGASGDLTPLSYVAAVLVGEREVLDDDRLLPASEALQEHGLSPLTLRPKEGLALMNGTAVMTALLCLAWKRAEYLTRLCSRITAMTVRALHGNPQHFDPRLFAAKPHAGQNEVAAWVFRDLDAPPEGVPSMRLQDRYSVRCAPHVIGVLRDALGWMKRDIENELNSANDNPLIDPDEQAIFHGGHFYGGHMAFVADSMKNAVANLADLMDRQMALLVDPNYNNGLPANLSGAEGERRPLNHGFKAVQIAVSAWTAEALKLTMPASVFSRSTECHNQDKVSMGTIAARDALRVIELVEQVAGACLFAASQALVLRERNGEPVRDMASQDLLEMLDEVMEIGGFVTEDRRMDSDLDRLFKAIRSQHWNLYGGGS